MERYGVIDLGTNTFHLLIAERNESGFRELYRLRQFVKLAEMGIGTIAPQPFQRGLEAVRMFHQLLGEHQVNNVWAFGTAALRTASNGQEFIRIVEAETGIRIQLITGDQEAELIHKGVIHAIPPTTQRLLIMDIGGGSVEFIIADECGKQWAQSFPIGLAVLYKHFHHNDPITGEEIDHICRFLDCQLIPLFEFVDWHPTPVLVGASGTFDVLENMLIGSQPQPLYSELPMSEFRNLFHRFRGTTHQQRIEMEELPNSRADLFIVALILIDYVLQKMKIRQLIVSAYSMKEGMLFDMIEGETQPGVKKST